jgi:hypothetical protein
MNENDLETQAAKLRDWADTLRRLAGRLRYDFGKRAQLHALADGFERRAEQLESAAMALPTKRY